MEKIYPLNQTVIDRVSHETVTLLRRELGECLQKIILYGSCSRGDYSMDSDIDMALLLSCDRVEAKKYSNVLAEIAADFAWKYLAIVNFVCLPDAEFEEKRSWYPYFKNIDREGIVLYGR